MWIKYLEEKQEGDSRFIHNEKLAPYKIQSFEGWHHGINCLHSENKCTTALPEFLKKKKFLRKIIFFSLASPEYFRHLLL